MNEKKMVIWKLIGGEATMLFSQTCMSFSHVMGQEDDLGSS